ncbi:hypothetical protein Trydic_g15872, partial [Trypoxylus dichotomus]
EANIDLKKAIDICKAAEQAKKHVEETDRNKEVDSTKKITDKDRRSNRNVSSAVEAIQRGTVQRGTRNVIIVKL